MIDVVNWLERYKEAWAGQDGHAVAALFAADGVYRAHPLREPYVGRDAIRDYWNEGSGTQQDIKMTVRTPVLVNGGLVAVEWFTTLKFKGADITLVGSLFLDFAEDGLCKELREYYFVEGGGLEEPPSAWT